MAEKTKLTFHSGVGSVTGANFLLEANYTKILVDCGLIQGEKWAANENRKAFPYNPAQMHYLFVTHAHLDHVGRIPKLIKDGFKGEIYSTPETKALARLILDDAVGLLAAEAQREGVLPLYEREHLEAAFGMWKEIRYHDKKTFVDFEVVLQDAGHILGSSMINFIVDGKKIVFTGDLGNTPTPLLRDTEPLDKADYLIMESVYGDRNHEPHEERLKKLKQVISVTIARDGAVVIPAFSLERTQVLLYELNTLIENNEIPHVPVYVDSPLATRVTEVYKNSKHLFNDATRAQIDAGDDIFSFPRLKFTIGHNDSRTIDNMPGAKIIIAGSGMSAGGRVVHHEEHYLPDPRNTILLVGYQTMGTLGRRLMDGAKKVNINGHEVEVKAHIDSIFGYSSHKDSEHLVEFVETSHETLKKVFVAMGEPKASLFLVQRLRDYLDVDALYPERGKTYEL